MLREQVAGVLATVGLRLSAEKTTICHIDEGFDFLGWRIQRHQQRGGHRRYVYTYPSRKALAAVKAKVRAVTGQTTNQSLGLMLLRLNWVLRGWAYYFRHGASSKTFAYLDAFAWRRVIRWLCRKHPRTGWRARSRCLTRARSPSGATDTGAHGSPCHGTKRPRPRMDRPDDRRHGLGESPVPGRLARRVRRRGPGKRTVRKGGTAPRLDPTGTCSRANWSAGC